MVQPSRIRVALDAHIVGRRGTGNETYILSLAEALAGRSDIDTVALLDAGTVWPFEEPPEIRYLRLRSPVLRIPLELPIAARRMRADLLHVQYVAPPVAGLPVVAAIHDLSFEDVPGLFRRPTELRLRLSVRATARRAAVIAAISSFTRDRIVELYGVSPERIVVTPVSVSPFWHSIDPIEQAATVAGLGLDVERPLVPAVGNLHPRKNLPRLIRAVDQVRRHGQSDLQLVLVGQRGWHATEVDAAIDSVSGREWVAFTGFVDDDTLRALYGAARVVAYVSLYEGLGLPVLEALACGAVVVASSTTAVPEAAGDAAILVDPASDEAVADGLRIGLEDESVRARLRVAGPRHAATFDRQRFAATTIAAYRLALSGG